MIYLCSGTDSEKLEWFKTINIAGEKLTDQELRNAVYHGPLCRPDLIECFQGRVVGLADSLQPGECLAAGFVGARRLQRAEVARAVTLIVRRPACAHFISRELATYFAGDTPPTELIDAMAGTFRRTDGDIAATLRTLFLSRQLTGLPAPKFKDPMRYVLSAVRLAYDGRTITNTRPLLDWLNALGEAPFGRATPDGYPLTGPGWESPGQMSRRFEIARAIGSGNVHLFDAEDTGAATTNRFPQLSNRLYYEAIEPFLAANTRSALDQARSPQEWNTFLLASPEMNYE